MLSNLIKKEVSKLLLVTFLYSNISPAFCLQGISEYVINVERRQTELGQMALMVTAKQLDRNTVATGALTYKTLIKQNVYPFMQDTPTMVATAKLYEVLQNIQASVTSNQTSSQTVDTQLSRGFCLSKSQSLVNC